MHWYQLGDELGAEGYGFVLTALHQLEMCELRASEQALSLRSDQTTRIYTAIPEKKGDENFTSSWHEVGHPQVHGYDILSVVSLDPLRFVSITDEKVVHVFGAPCNFVRTLQGLGVVDLEVDKAKSASPSE